MIKEALQWYFEQIDQMELAEKDIFIVIGPSRVGKGTLLSALQGWKMKLFKRTAATLKYSEVAQSSSTLNFLAPCYSGNGEPVNSSIISHQRNSHTLKPKIVGGPNDFGEEFYELLQGHYLVDFPGIFESRGIELEISIRLAL